MPPMMRNHHIDRMLQQANGAPDDPRSDVALDYLHLLADYGRLQRDLIAAHRAHLATCGLLLVTVVTLFGCLLLMVMK